MEQVRNVVVGVVLSLLAYLKPIEGELSALFLIFFLNFLFGDLTGAIAKGEDFNFKKALRCIGEATVFFVLCVAVFMMGKFKGKDAGALQCVSFITYVVIYFYTKNILRNLKILFKDGTTPWMVVSFLYYVLRFKFIEKIPYLSDYLEKASEATQNHGEITERTDENEEPKGHFGGHRE